MLSLKDIKGQNNAVKFLTSCISLERIPNAFLFYGPEGVGRALAAKTFVSSLFCASAKTPAESCGTCPDCRRVDALQHPDLLWIRPEKNKGISVDEIRKAKDTLNLKPYEAPYNICVIEDAHMMRAEAANAMLKMLEEPPARSLLILISSKKELLLPTVISRCSEVRFRYLSVKDTEDIILKDDAMDERSAHFLASFSQGSPGTALEMVKDGLMDRRKALFIMLERVFHAEAPAFMTWDVETKDAILEDIELVLVFLRDAAFAKEGLGVRVLDREAARSGAAELIKSRSVEQLHRMTEGLIDLKRAVMGNANPKIAAQALPMVLRG
jgi:DNA polymerase-3 subunit delta'